MEIRFSGELKILTAQIWNPGRPWTSSLASLSLSSLLCKMEGTRVPPIELGEENEIET